MSEWISVKDRLPEPEERVLTYGKYGVRELSVVWHLMMPFWRGHEEGWILANEVTHWMPLPEPPKEE